MRELLPRIQIIPLDRHSTVPDIRLPVPALRQSFQTIVLAPVHIARIIRVSPVISLRVEQHTKLWAALPSPTRGNSRALLTILCRCRSTRSTRTLLGRPSRPSRICLACIRGIPRLWSRLAQHLHPARIWIVIVARAISQPGC